MIFNTQLALEKAKYQFLLSEMLYNMYTADGAYWIDPIFLAVDPLSEDGIFTSERECQLIPEHHAVRSFSSNFDNEKCTFFFVHENSYQGWSAESLEEQRNTLKIILEQSNIKYIRLKLLSFLVNDTLGGPIYHRTIIRPTAMRYKSLNSWKALEKEIQGSVPPSKKSKFNKLFKEQNINVLWDMCVNLQLNVFIKSNFPNQRSNGNYQRRIGLNSDNYQAVAEKFHMIALQNRSSITEGFTEYLLENRTLNLSWIQLEYLEKKLLRRMRQRMMAHKDIDSSSRFGVDRAGLSLEDHPFWGSCEAYGDFQDLQSLKNYFQTHNLNSFIEFLVANDVYDGNFVQQLRRNREDR